MVKAWRCVFPCRERRKTRSALWAIRHASTSMAFLTRLLQQRLQRRHCYYPSRPHWTALRIPSARNDGRRRNPRWTGFLSQRNHNFSIIKGNGRQFLGMELARIRKYFFERGRTRLALVSRHGALYSRELKNRGLRFVKAPGISLGIEDIPV